MYNTFGENGAESTASGSAAMSKRSCCFVYAKSVYMALGFTVFVPQGPLVYWVLETAENCLINVIIDSKGNILNLLFREDKTHN